MKMEERDRLIREEGEVKGKTPLISIIRRKAAKGMDAAGIADLLETGQEEIEAVQALAQTHPEWTDFQIAEVIVRQE